MHAHILVAKMTSLIENSRNFRDAAERNEIELINILVARYNHELNNPLAIVIGYVKKAKKEKSLEYFDKINDSLQRKRIPRKGTTIQLENFIRVI